MWAVAPGWRAARPTRWRWGGLAEVGTRHRSSGTEHGSAASPPPRLALVSESRVSPRAPALWSRREASPRRRRQGCWSPAPPAAPVRALQGQRCWSLSPSSTMFADHLRISGRSAVDWIGTADRSGCVSGRRGGDLRSPVLGWYRTAWNTPLTGSAGRSALSRDMRTAWRRTGGARAGANGALDGLRRGIPVPAQRGARWRRQPRS